MRGYKSGVIIGIICGLLIASPSLMSSWQHSKIINECEKDLPRSERCVIVGVKAND